MAVDESGGKVSLVVVLGTGSAERYLGGTVFSDANHNGTYDAGEAKGGVKVSVGDLSTSSGPTGYWSLAVKATEPLDVVFSIDDLHGTRSIPSGPCSVLVNWRVPKAADLITVKKLISEAEKDATSTDEGKRRKALSALLAGARMIPLDDSLQRQVDQLTQPIREDYDELIRKVLNSLGEDPQGFKRRMNELKLPWKGCLVALFKEIEVLHQVRQLTNEMTSAKSDRRGAVLPGLKNQITAAMTASGEPLLQEQFQTLRDTLDHLPPPPAEPTKSK